MTAKLAFFQHGTQNSIYTSDTDSKIPSAKFFL